MSVQLWGEVRMRIAQVLDTLNWGGAQKMQLFLVENLCPLGVDITVVSLSAATDSPIPGLLQKAGARVVAFDFPHLFSPMSFLRLVGFFAASALTWCTPTSLTATLSHRWQGG